MEINKFKSELKEISNLGGHPKFYELLLKIAKLHAYKNSDYAGNDDPLSNLRGSERLGIPAWKGVLVRIGDKFDRINNIAKKGSISVKSESIKDTLEDMAVYSLLCHILYDESGTVG